MPEQGPELRKVDSVIKRSSDEILKIKYPNFEWNGTTYEMSIEATKLGVIQQLMKVESEELLVRIKELMDEERANTYASNLKPMTVEELDEKLKQSEDDVKAGRTFTTDEVRAHFKIKKNDS